MTAKPILPKLSDAKLRTGSRIGKYRLDRRIGVGGFATVYAATDTLLNVKVALKIPSSRSVSEDLLTEFRREASLTIGLEHPNILPIRDASFIDGFLVIVSPLGSGTLDDRLKKRMSFATVHSIATQLIDGVAFAHEHQVIHCDIKPENILLFDEGVVRLGDFGIAKAVQRTISGSGTGTLGYMAPEQAMGKPSTRSDVFSIGLILYRMFAGQWPEYPFDWPFAGAANLRRRAHPDLIALIRKSVSVRPKDRFVDAIALSEAWEKCRIKSLRFANR